MSSMAAPWRARRVNDTAEFSGKVALVTGGTLAVHGGGERPTYLDAGADVDPVYAT